MLDLIKKAEKWIKAAYGQDVSLNEIIAEAKNLLRKEAVGKLDDFDSRLFSCLEKEEWQEISKMPLGNE